MPVGPFALQWHTPTPNPPLPTPLPEGLHRRFIPTPSGPLELLVAQPKTFHTPSKPPLFFAHGGFGCASIWIPYMLFFSSRGSPCYALSYRGHGGSWYPSFWGMYFTTRGTMAGDLVKGIQEVERLEGRESVLIAHSAGAALGQYVLSRKLVRVKGFAMVGGVPGFGSWSVYKFWSLTAPFHFPYRFFHPRYILATTQQVHAAFFTLETPVAIVKNLESLLSPYESMLWPLQALFRFVTGPDVVSSIEWSSRTGKTPQGVADRFLILAAEKDVLCTPGVLRDAADRYGAAFRECVRNGMLEGVHEADIRPGDCGIRFRVARGLGHHLQNHVEWERGAEEILEWVEQL